jgi:hypothetical protein
MSRWCERLSVSISTIRVGTAHARRAIRYAEADITYDTAAIAYAGIAIAYAAARFAYAGIAIAYAAARFAYAGIAIAYAAARFAYACRATAYARGDMAYAVSVITSRPAHLSYAHRVIGFRVRDLASDIGIVMGELCAGSQYHSRKRMGSGHTQSLFHLLTQVVLTSILAHSFEEKRRGFASPTAGASRHPTWLAA